MAKTVFFDICIIGAGSGGLSVAAVAAQMGAKVCLIEASKMGGDCLNYGCVPSKSLLAAAKNKHRIEQAKNFGIHAKEIEVNFSEVMAHVHKVINTIAVNDSVERFEGFGVKVISAKAKFINRNSVKAGNEIIQAKRFVIATGSSPAIAPIPGIENITYLTNETIFDLKQLPKHLIIIGAGPIGCEMAQAFRYLGAQVTLIEAFNMMPRDDQELVTILKQKFAAEKIKLYEQAKITSVSQTNEQYTIHLEHENQSLSISGTHLLLATGRKANIFDLDLEKANVNYQKNGIVVNRRLKTSNKKIYAVGDAIGQYQFTHVANYHAGIVIRNILFHLPAKVNYHAIPWVTYTDPEVAQVGITEVQANQQQLKHKVISWPYKENDRAQAEAETLGKIKVVLNHKGVILGASIIGAHAGELIMPWVKAIQQRWKIKAMTDFIVAYPTLSEINKRVAQDYFTPILYSKRMKKIVRWLMKLS